MSDKRSERIVWVDLEMSGLNVEKERILEMACLVTDAELNVIAEANTVVIKQDDQLLDSMDDWCKTHHGKSGLTKAVKASNLSEEQAEDAMLEFIKKHTDSGQSPLAGNSVHMDRMFLSRYMPCFTAHLHYRIIDVSTIKELARRWNPDVFKSAPRKKLEHRALDDIKESINELRFYREHLMKST